jgi:exosortase
MAREPQTRLRLLAACGAAALLAWIFRHTLVHFTYTWSNDENYSHGWLVPLLSLYFANEATRRRGPEGPTALRGAWLGFSLLTLAVLARLGTILVPLGIASDVGFLLGIAGLVALYGGSETLKRYAFPVAFLAFMIPLPIALYTAIAAPLQLAVSRMGAGVLNLLGIPVLCEGNMMTLPGDVQMFVAEACSGMRQLTGFLALTTAVAMLSPRPNWIRTVLIASAIPIAMSANVLRVVVTGWLMASFGPRFATGHLHTLEGLALMGVGLGMLAVECRILALLTPSNARPSPSPIRPALAELST